MKVTCIDCNKSYDCPIPDGRYATVVCSCGCQLDISPRIVGWFGRVVGPKITKRATQPDASK